ncbi:MAG: helix-turn-helix transcriptional regulator [Chitinophagaceae bacterium]|nr:helix-turn-helix transcriptional regulator [Chitinophagaceae bacterium]
MGAKLKDGWLFIPPQLAHGYIRYIKLPNGLQVMIMNATAVVTWDFQKRKSTDETYTLRFDDVIVPEKLELGNPEHKFEQKQGNFSAAYLTSSLYDWRFIAYPGTRIKGVNVLIPKKELGHMLGIEVMEKIMPAYIALQTKSYTIEPLNSYYRELMEEIMNEDPDTPFPELYVMNRVQLLVERFFSSIRSRMEIADVSSNLKTSDIQTIIEVEQYMLEDFSRKPPSINDLSRKAAMSATKFKNLFKAVYGIPVYEYYQQKRMQTAADLLAGGMSVKEAGLKIGYNNISNFSAAFKKQYKVLPHDYKLS